MPTTTRGPAVAPATSTTLATSTTPATSTTLATSTTPATGLAPASAHAGAPAAASALAPATTAATTTATTAATTAAWDDVRWSLVSALLGPVAGRQPDLALSLLACVDEAVAAGRARWRRHGPWPARP